MLRATPIAVCENDFRLNSSSVSRAVPLALRLLREPHLRMDREVTRPHPFSNQQFGLSIADVIQHLWIAVQHRPI